MEVRTQAGDPDLQKIAPLILIAVGLLFGAIGMGPVVDAIKTRDWVPVSATVVSAEEFRNPVNGGQNRTSDHNLRVSYSYSVDGQRFSGSMAVLPEWKAATDEAGIERLRAVYAEGARVEVYADPSDPAVSTIRRGFDLTNLIPFGAALGMTGMGAFWWLRNRRAAASGDGGPAASTGSSPRAEAPPSAEAPTGS